MSIPPKASPIYKPTQPRLAVPPVYRPNQVSASSAQLKPVNKFRLETQPAPPIYRLGENAHRGVQPKAGRLALESSPAPPVYRPQATDSQGVQTKSANPFKLEIRPAPLVYHPIQGQTGLQPKANGILPIENRTAPPLYRPQEFSPGSTQLKLMNLNSAPVIPPQPFSSFIVQHKIQTTTSLGQIPVRNNFQPGHLAMPGVVQTSSTRGGRGGRGGRQRDTPVSRNTYPQISRDPYYVRTYSHEKQKHYERRVLRASAFVRYAIGYYGSEGEIKKDWYDFTTPTFNSGKPGRGWTHGGAWHGRTHDAEAKVYQWIYDYFVKTFGNFLDSVVAIVVNLASEEGPCNSCRAVRRKFKELFDCDVTVNTLAGKGTYNQKIESESLRKRYGRDRVTYGHTHTKRVLRRSGSPARFETVDSNASDSEE
jgi:hypothetical protein